MQIHVTVIQIPYKFHGILPANWLLTYGCLLILNQYIYDKGNNSCTTDASLIKLDLHQHIMVIYTCIHVKFHRIPLTGYLVMATDRYDRQMDGT